MLGSSVAGAIPGEADIIGDPSTHGSADGPVVPDGDDPGNPIWSHVMLLVQLMFR